MSVCVLVAPVFSTAAQQEKPEINLVGNSALSKEEVLSIFSDGRIASTAGGLDSLLQDIRGVYARHGYLRVAIDSVEMTTDGRDGIAGNLVIHILEGPQAIVGTVRFTGLTALSESAANALLDLPTATPFLPRKLEEGIERILNRYEAVGYPFAKVRVQDVQLANHGDSDFAHIVIAVDEGPVLTIDEIRVEGNSNTRSDVIVREARVNKGMFPTFELRQRIKRRLERMPLFSRVSLPEYFVTRDGRGGILLRVEEGNPNRFDGILGYVPSSKQGEQGFVTGLVSIHLGNLFGTGRRLSTRWQKEDRLTEEIGVRYLEPWVLSLPLNAEIGFSQRRQNSTYTRRLMDGRIDVMATDQLSFGVSLTQSDVFPAEGRQSSVPQSQSRSLGAFFSYDTRDRSFSVTQGLRYFTEYQTGSKRNTGAAVGSNTVQKIILDVEYFHAIAQRQILATSLHGREFKSGSIEASDLFQIGGTTTLRGYRENQFQGSRLAWATIEYRYLVDDRTFAYAFVDGGYVLTPEIPRAGLSTVEHQKIGYGIGVAAGTALGVIGVSIALGEGDTFSTAKLHVRLVNEF
ncbi:MAG TPA: POTRA domain-containing protein [Bacteroidota bacterium]|nr:POTRA domain-containing protein [Bacteroidota bacterium]